MQEKINTTYTPKRRSRRSYTTEFKAQVVAQCQGEKSIAQIALDHQINANLIHKWCRQFEQSDQPSMVPVAMAHTAALTTDCSRVDVLIGEVTLGLVGNVDPQTARVVLEALR